MNCYDANPYELIYYYRCGCEWAMEWLVIMYRNLMHRIVTEICHARPELQESHDDLYVEAMMGLHDALRTYRDDTSASFYTFLVLVAKRSIMNSIRQYMLNDNFQADSCLISLDRPVGRNAVLYDVVYSDNSLSNPLYCMKLENFMHDLDRTASCMNDREKQVLYRWMQGDKYKDAARKLGCSEKAYDGYMQRVRKKVLRTLFDNGYKPLKSCRKAALH